MSQFLGFDTVLVVLVALAGCRGSTSSRAGASIVEDARSATPDPLVAQPPATYDHADVTRRDVRGTAASIAAVTEAVRSLDPARRTAAARSLRFLSVNCPYTRSALQLPFALHQVAMGIETARLDPFVRTDWETLRAGLAAHVGALEALGVDLAAPAPGDHLHDRGPAAQRSVATLRAAPDPISLTDQLLDELPTIAAQLTPATTTLIDHHSTLVEQITGVARPCGRGPWAKPPGQPWTLGLQLGGWHDALRRLAPFAVDDTVRGQITSMIELLARYEETSS